MEIKKLHHNTLKIESLTTKPGETWCFWGDNNSGIDAFMTLLAGNLEDFSASRLALPKDPGIVSFNRQQLLFEEELRRDDSDFLDRTDPGTPIKEFLTEYRSHDELIRSFGMEHVVNMGYRQLSSGQCKKFILLQQVTAGKNEIIIQNPYDGLDRQSCQELDRIMEKCIENGIQVFALVNSPGDIPFWCSHVGHFSRGQLDRQGEKNTVLHDISTPTTILKNSWTPLLSRTMQNKVETAIPLIRLRNGYGGYGDHKLFSGLNLEIFPGDHTLITGKNGCGKSTLLNIITGDNSKCYANDLSIFGRQRGSGESIWEIKRYMGIVSPALHRDYRVPGSTLQAVVSGFFNSIGLYRKVNAQQIDTARYFLRIFGLSDLETIPFRNLSHAHRRLVLIARALIKQPKLLILDEPSQGLDDLNRKRLMELMVETATRRLATILFVSHRGDEHHPLFRQHINLEQFISGPKVIQKNRRSEEKLSVLPK